MKRRITGLVLAVLSAVLVMAGMQAPASAAGDGSVNSNEFWTGLTGITEYSFEHNICGCTPTFTDIITAGGEKGVFYRANNQTFTRDINEIELHMYYLNGVWSIWDWASGLGGKEQLEQGTTRHWNYGVGCHSATDTVC